MSTWAVRNPADESVLAEVELADADAVDAAVASAAGAFPRWSAVSQRDRALMLRRLANLVREHAGGLHRLESANVGKPLAASGWEPGAVADVFDYYAGWIDKRTGDSFQLDDGLAVTLHEPFGVAALVTPWNYPMLIASWKIAPALACGNTAVVKPSELTPLTTMRLADLAREAGIPEGVLNVVVGDGPTAGHRLVTHPDVRKVSFTGSTATGVAIMKACADDLKRVTLELGGKAANIVFADADLGAAATGAAWAALENAGQDCCARSRVLVERQAYDSFVERLVAATAELRCGDPTDPEVRIGPLVSAAHREKVAGFVDGSFPVAYRGAVPTGPGYWYPPTVLVEVDPRSRIAQEEVFGPVATVIPFDDEAEAVAIANGTRYGLATSLWTRDLGRATRLSRRISVGTLSVNSNTAVRTATPFGGARHSGIGRELGRAALDQYTDTKTVFLAAGD